MRKMTLSAAEKKGVRIKDGGGGKKSSSPSTNLIQAVGKLFSEKLAHPDSLEQALGRIWCPMRGIECKGLGENKFLFTFHQATGKKKALDEGPWNLSKELLVVTDLDESKTLDELEFSFTPIWVQVLQLPLGMMNSETAEAIGDEIGEFMDVDTDDGKKAVGRFLRIKVRIDIRKPLMRGVTVIADSNGVERWCPVAYEHLPDFCYICGLLGHIDKLCDIAWEKGKPLPYDRSLRVFPPKKKGTLEAGGRGGSNSMLPWRSNSGGSGSRGSLSGSFGKSQGDQRSDALNWRKDDAGREEDGKVGSRAGEEKEVMSPMKISDKALLMSDKGEKDAKKSLLPDLSSPADMNHVILDMNSAMHAAVKSGVQLPLEIKNLNVKKRKWTRGGQRKGERQEEGKPKGSVAHTSSSSPTAKKRGREEEMVDVVELVEDGMKRARNDEVGTVETVDKKSLLAGPADRSCESQ